MADNDCHRRRGRFFGIIPIDSRSVWAGGMAISVMLGAISAGCLSTLSPFLCLSLPTTRNVPVPTLATSGPDMLPPTHPTD